MRKLRIDTLIAKVSVIAFLLVSLSSSLHGTQTQAEDVEGLANKIILEALAKCKLEAGNELCTVLRGWGSAMNNVVLPAERIGGIGRAFYLQSGSANKGEHYLVNLLKQSPNIAVSAFVLTAKKDEAADAEALIADLEAGKQALMNQTYRFLSGLTKSIPYYPVMKQKQAWIAKFSPDAIGSVVFKYDGKYLYVLYTLISPDEEGDYKPAVVFSRLSLFS